MFSFSYAIESVLGTVYILSLRSFYVVDSLITMLVVCNVYYYFFFLASCVEYGELTTTIIGRVNLVGH